MSRKADPKLLQHATAVLAPVPAYGDTSRRERWYLSLRASMWRFLMEIGMICHRFASPWPRGPDFRRMIPSTISTSEGMFKLVFYTPEGYGRQKGKLYPCVVNFHGGGFTIGKASDDVRWARAVNAQTDAVVVSVAYRLAPEYPFPTAVEDGADAIMYLMSNADELHIDPDNIAVSGFSAGGNMAFTVPIRLHEELRMRREKGLPTPEGKVVAISAWYPSTDFTKPRSERRKTNTRPEKELPKFFTDLFDSSYLYPTEGFTFSSPYLSPGVAPMELLKAALPEDIVLFTCEWDELLAEGERFHRRLEDEIGKKVRYKNIKGVPHGFDKDPNPFWRDPQIDVLYTEVCAELKKVFYGEGL